MEHTFSQQTRVEIISSMDTQKDLYLRKIDDGVDVGYWRGKLKDLQVAMKEFNKVVYGIEE